MQPSEPGVATADSLTIPQAALSDLETSGIATVEQWRQDSITLNTVSYALLKALGKVKPGEDGVGDPETLVRELIADRDTADRIRAECQLDRDQHAALVREILAKNLETWMEPLAVAEWKSRLAQTVAGSWRDERKRLLAVIEEIAADRDRMCAVVDAVRAFVADDWLMSGLASGGRHRALAEALAVFDGTASNPVITTEAPAGSVEGDDDHDGSSEDLKPSQTPTSAMRGYAIAARLATADWIALGSEPGMAALRSAEAERDSARRERDIFATRVDYLETLTGDLGRRLNKAQAKVERKSAKLASVEKAYASASAALRDFQAANRQKTPVVDAARAVAELEWMDSGPHADVRMVALREAIRDFDLATTQIVLHVDGTRKVGSISALSINGEIAVNFTDGSSDVYERIPGRHHEPKIPARSAATDGN